MWLLGTPTLAITSYGCTYMWLLGTPTLAITSYGYAYMCLIYVCKAINDRNAYPTGEFGGGAVCCIGGIGGGGGRREGDIRGQIGARVGIGVRSVSDQG